MSSGAVNYDRINNYGAVRISLASPHDIRSWSFGEVKKPETINYSWSFGEVKKPETINYSWSFGEVKKPETINFRTNHPVKDGLFCERIFGPKKAFECACGKYRGMKYKGMICDRCGVKVTHSRVRRKRMGHIELAAPVVHIWFFKAMPSRLGTLLDMKTTSLEKIIYFQDYVVTDPGEEGATQLKKHQLLNEYDFRKARESYGDAFQAEKGAEAVKKMLEVLNLVDLSKELRTKLESESKKDKPSKQKLRDLVKRLKVVESLRDSGLGGPQNKAEWMVLECIPVIPPDLRPLVLLDSGNFATSDLNDLYRRIINRNNRLKKLVDLNAPEVIIRNEKRMLQQSVDALFDNNRCKRPVLGSSNRPLKSLTDMIKGKQGRFRENLLGKRVDYSARSVIVVGPELRLHQCGLPKKIALELFQPFIIRRLKELGHADTIKSAKKMLERKDDTVWDILEEVIRNHPVLLNRAPTLHRMGIQAFEPVLIEGNAIRIHPLVCKGFNADFDGDQMAVHLPLSIEAQVEATVLMMSTNNIFSPANGQPIISPSQDIVMGCYYLTATRGELGESTEAGEGKKFGSPAEVHTAYALKKLGVHARIWVRLPIEKKVVSEVRVDKDKMKTEEVARKPNGLVLTTVGRVIFNDILHPKMAFYDLALASKTLARIIADCYQLLGRRQTIELLDRMKEIGFRESTRSGLSFSADDLKTPSCKRSVLRETQHLVDHIAKHYEEGNICEAERYNTVIDLWTYARDEITKQMMEDLKNDRRDGAPYLNPIFLMAHSGARGGVEQIRQLAGMRGLTAKPNGTIIETPIKANFREGLSVLEYFSSTHGARKGLADTALKTADSRYLTYKLADVAQNVVVTTHDCGTTQGVSKSAVYKGEEIERPLSDSIRGRVSCNTLRDPVSDKAIVGENEMITWEAARTIERMGLDKILVRSPMTCQAPLGVCRLCYGMDLATGSLVEEGMAVGIIAAQSIGEPGTQLTMRTFHIGGVVKHEMGESAVKAKRPGKVKFERVEIVVNEKKDAIALARNGEVLIVGPKGQTPESYAVPNGAQVMVKDGQEVEAGAVICRWEPHITPIVSDRPGKVRFDEIVEGETLRTERDMATGAERRVIMEHKGELHPQLVIENDEGQPQTTFYMPEKAFLEVKDGQRVMAGSLLAKTPRESAGTQDITGGLPRVTEIFEARTPRDPAKMAEVAGVVRLGEKKRGKRTIYIQPVDDAGAKVGEEREHQVPPGRRLRVHTGDRVKEGDRLVFGPLVPQEILKISGTEEVQKYLVQEVQTVYRAQRVEIDDKHIEIIVSQMLRKVQVKAMGDTGLLPGSVIDRFSFQAVNDRLKECVKIKDAGDSKFEEGKVVGKEAFEEERTRLEVEDKSPPTFVEPSSASNTTQLLGITKAAVRSESFISAASFQETTKVLTEAALAGKVDYLVGLKENVILGHLVPAGTGFRTHQEAEVRLNAQAVEAALAEADEMVFDAPPVAFETPLEPRGDDAAACVVDTARGVLEEQAPTLPEKNWGRDMVRDGRLARLRAMQQEFVLAELTLQTSELALQQRWRGLEEREGELCGLQERLARREGVAQQRRRDLEEAEKELSRLQDDLGRREAGVAERRRRVEAAEQETEIREAAANARKDEIGQFEAELGRRRADAEKEQQRLLLDESNRRPPKDPQRPQEAAGVRAGERSVLEAIGTAPSAHGTLSVTAPGMWFARPAKVANAAWVPQGPTPGVVQVVGGEVYGLSISRDASDDQLAGVAGLASFSELFSLSLNGSVKITDGGLIPIGRLSQLRTLSLSECTTISGVGLAHLHGLTRLEWLSLHGCVRLTDGGLARLRPLSDLRTLRLSQCLKITDAGLAHLHSLQSLRRLHLEGCFSPPRPNTRPDFKGITPVGLAALQAALPSCEISGV